MSDSSNSRTRKATDAVKRGAEVAANGIYQATDFVARNDGRIADGAQAFTDAVLTLLSNTGQAANLGAKAHQAALANFSRTVVERDLTQALKIIFE